MKSSFAPTCILFCILLFPDTAEVSSDLTCSVSFGPSYRFTEDEYLDDWGDGWMTTVSLWRGIGRGAVLGTEFQLHRYRDSGKYGVYYVWDPPTCMRDPLWGYSAQLMLRLYDRTTPEILHDNRPDIFITLGVGVHYLDFGAFYVDGRESDLGGLTPESWGSTLTLGVGLDIPTYRNFDIVIETRAWAFTGDSDFTIPITFGVERNF